MNTSTRAELNVFDLGGILTLVALHNEAVECEAVLILSSPPMLWGNNGHASTQVAGLKTWF